jgi:hypothetical protein
VNSTSSWKNIQTISKNNIRPNINRCHNHTGMSRMDLAILWYDSKMNLCCSNESPDYKIPWNCHCRRCCCCGYQCIVQELIPRGRDLQSFGQKNSLAVIEPEGPLPRWHQLTTDRCQFIVVYASMYTGHPTIPLGFPTVISHVCATCPVHLILLDLIIQIIRGHCGK